MNAELPSYRTICNIVQQEETRRKVMNLEVKSITAESSAYVSKYKQESYKGKKADVKCSHCGGSHMRDKCWILIPELKVKFLKDKEKEWNNSGHKANVTNVSSSASTSSGSSIDFTNNPCALIKDFAVYLHKQKNDEDSVVKNMNHTTLLSKFAGFLAEAEHMNKDDISDKLCGNPSTK
ncbi:uncharacterized protein LOC126788527 [Argentina anserina]|uniref:uncharacterized protein LOC126788527 n=1 Tax=Argentina anserina TaxID=57926 RepID=UPI00217655D5|nr:uncharacterized protein LOC126788527 [Potentilla anserina]